MLFNHLWLRHICSRLYPILEFKEEAQYLHLQVRLYVWQGHSSWAGIVYSCTHKNPVQRKDALCRLVHQLVISATTGYSALPNSALERSVRWSWVKRPQTDSPMCWETGHCVGRQLSLEIVSLLGAVWALPVFSGQLDVSLGILTGVKTSGRLLANPSSLALRKMISIWEDVFQRV